MRRNGPLRVAGQGRCLTLGVNLSDLEPQSGLCSVHPPTPTPQAGPLALNLGQDIQGHQWWQQCVNVRVRCWVGGQQGTWCPWTGSGLGRCKGTAMLGC